MSNFEKLWNNHPTVESRFDDFSCKVNDKKAFDNQCAIRVGVSLDKSGYDTSTFKGVRCWHKHSPAHILRAEELANWLNGNFSPFKRTEVFDGVKGFGSLSGKKGIIFFKNYYGQNNQGDHIDFWNGSRLTRYSSWFEFALRDGGYYEEATVWFWPVN